MDKANVNDDMDVDAGLNSSRPLIKKVIYHCPSPTTSTYFYYNRNVNEQENGNSNTSKFELIGTEESSSGENVAKIQGTKRPYPWPYYKVYEPPAKMIRYSLSYHYMKYGR